MSIEAAAQFLIRQRPPELRLSIEFGPACDTRINNDQIAFPQVPEWKSR